ncbi:hypothetical protein E2C01_002045 [Portunus trituberculatus]|uniref:Uncharacterized protein n=1 Tax=Portunus trituberculatus TaxID=210409 RepID=A0A5B7CIB8_PORTR|nr:hypothetical protein [Portunus trituberculatus]
MPHVPQLAAQSQDWWNQRPSRGSSPEMRSMIVQTPNAASPLATLLAPHMCSSCSDFRVSDLFRGIAENTQNSHHHAMVLPQSTATADSGADILKLML